MASIVRVFAQQTSPSPRSAEVNAATRGMLELVVIDHVEDLIASLLGPEIVCVYLQCLAAQGVWSHPLQASN